MELNQSRYILCLQESSGESTNNISAFSQSLFETPLRSPEDMICKLLDGLIEHADDACDQHAETGVTLGGADVPSVLLRGTRISFIPSDNAESTTQYHHNAGMMMYNCFHADEQDLLARFPSWLAAHATKLVQEVAIHIGVANTSLAGGDRSQVTTTHDKA